MLDQSFSVQNLFHIYKAKNNKGNNVVSRFFPEVIESHEKIKRLRNIISAHYLLRRKHSEVWFQKRISNLYLLLKLLKKNRNDIVLEKLSEVSSNITSRSYQFDVVRSPFQKNGKDVYLLDGTPESFFAEKQIQRNIKYTYKVKQNDRDIIIPQLKSCLSNNYPIHVIRTDIKSFYEKINPEILMDKLNKNAMLSLSSRKIIAKLLRSYKGLSGGVLGIPRGIGISAYLSELYLKEFDRKVRGLENLVYYARYVDDIILIVAPESIVSKEFYLDYVKSCLKEEDLEINDDKDKTSVFIFPDENSIFEFDYLGYKFKKKGMNVELSISDKKNNKYISKIDYCIDKFNKSSAKTPRLAARELKVRLRFLTSNTRLSSNKGNAVIGIYSNNKWVTDYKFLDYLDHQLNRAVAKLSDASLRSKIGKRYSFKEGFEDRKFSNFSSSEFLIIGRDWGL